MTFTEEGIQFSEAEPTKKGSRLWSRYGADILTFFLFVSPSYEAVLSGGEDTYRIYAMTPILHTSTSLPYGFCASTSGAANKNQKLTIIKANKNEMLTILKANKNEMLTILKANKIEMLTILKANKN